MFAAGIASSLATPLGANLGSSARDWLIDLAELTVVYPCPDIAAREKVWNLVLSEMIALGPRLDRLRLDILHDLSGILGGREIVAEIARVAQSALAPPQLANTAPTGRDVVSRSQAQAVSCHFFSRSISRPIRWLGRRWLGASS